MSERDASPELAALEEQLRLLVPREEKIDRDTLLFRAGRASVRPSWAWPLATAASTLMAITLGVALVSRPDTPVIEHVVYVPVERPVAETAPEPSGGASSEAEPPQPIALDHLPPHRRLQEHLLRWGLDGLGEVPTSAPAAPTARDLFSHYSELSSGVSIP